MIEEFCHDREFFVATDFTRLSCSDIDFFVVKENLRTCDFPCRDSATHTVGLACRCWGRALPRTTGPRREATTP